MSDRHPERPKPILQSFDQLGRVFPDTDNALPRTIRFRRDIDESILDDLAKIDTAHEGKSS